MTERKFNRKLHKRIRRVISFALILILVFGDITLPDFRGQNDGKERKETVFSAVKVKAAPVTYTYDSVNKVATITSVTDLINYSINYHSEEGHDTDRLEITLSGTTTDAYTGFMSIGSASKPFNGSILFGQSSATNFNINVPLFGTVYESVKIQKSINNTPTDCQIEIDKSGSNENHPLFAEKVLSDGDATTSANWSVNAESFNGNCYSNSGLIGEIEAGASVNMTFVNNAYVSSDTQARIVGSENVGVLCGTMGAGSELTVNYSGSNVNFTVVSSAGHAGGLVGAMGNGSVLNVTTAGNPQTTADAYVRAASAGKYAGGLVGYNDGGSVSVSCTGGYAINQMITGYEGEGGLFGYYNAASADTLDISGFTVDCKLNTAEAMSDGRAGGLIGHLVNADSFTISGGTGSTVTAVTSTLDVLNASNTDGNIKASLYGGLIGEYSAQTLANTLTIQNISAVANSTLEAPTFGGAIAKVSGLAYVAIDNFTLTSVTGQNNVDESSFGGVVADAQATYLNLSNITIGTGDGISSIRGGGLVGKLGNGVLKMSGAIDVSKATPTGAASNGQIVATRDNALIYADAGWTYTRSSAEVDNVASWGDVIVFNNTTLTKAGVLTEDATAHTITIGSPTTANVIADVEDYAKISVLSQIAIGNSNTTNRILRGTNITAGTALSLSNGVSIDLTGTSLKGITRDNGSTRIEYSGATFNGNGGTIKLDIQNVGGKPIYYHNRNGLFAKVNGTTFSNLTMDGSVQINTKQDGIYVGAMAAEATGALSLTSCNTASTLAITVNGDKKSGTAGRAVGVANSNIANITVNGGTYDGTLTCTNSSDDYYLGGVIGRIGKNTNSAVEWVFQNFTITGTVSGTASKTQKIGGLVAGIMGYDANNFAKSLRNLSITDVTANNFTISGSSNGNGMGGFLGYSWSDTNVALNSLTVSGTSNLTMTGSGQAAGLVYSATGKWNIGNLNMSSVKMSLPNAKSVGFIVNKGYIEAEKDRVSYRKGIYLEVNPSTYTISLDGNSTFKSDAVYDEICAYSAKSDVMDNEQGIISIIIANAPKMESTATSSLTYLAKTAKAQSTPNPNTRYYYNLNTIDDRNGNLSSDPAKLMRWGLNQYACKNIKDYFPNPFPGNSISGTFSMQGYSWYPVTVNSAVTVAGTFAFFNSEFETCESAKTNTKYSSLEKTQHYMMQNGLFYNVKNDVTIGNITLQGNIGAVDTNGTGALIYGTISGTEEHVTTVSSANGSIVLDGIKVHNYSTKSDDYAPLLINKATGYVTLEINDVSNTNNVAYYNRNDNMVATSLIGKLGNNTAKQLNVTFSKIKLDARSVTNAATNANQIGTGTNSIYHTNRSIFTRATLLESLSFESESSGVYNFTYDEDWGEGNRAVTYGKELGYENATSGDTNANTNQYPGLEQKYSGSSYYVSYKPGTFTNASSAGTQYFLTQYLPYVKTVNKSSSLYQLSVNHASVELEGCGTYNDPYVIDEGAKLEGISRMIRGTFNTGDVICVPAGGVTSTWCTDKTTPDHHEFSYDGSNFTATGQSNITKADMQKHLAGAYYIVKPKTGDSITVSNADSFKGLGTSAAETMFRGVIFGNDKEIINKTQYPLIVYSNGSVVKDLTVTVDKSFSLTGNNSNTFPTNDKAYGAVMGQIHGGDNIIDNVTVGFGNSVITLSGDKAQLVPTGGYVGVIVFGGLIFRNMGSVASTSKLAASNVTTDQSGKVVSDMTATTSTHETTNDLWLYVNPYVGRVIYGYAVNEAGAYHAREATQTLKNGTKHYSITDIGANTKLDVSGSTITVPDAQSFFLMSVIVNSGMGMKATADAIADGYNYGYYKNYSTTRHGTYAEVGQNSSDDYNDYAINDIYWSRSSVTDAQKQGDTPYLIGKYTTGSSSENYLAKTLGGASTAWTVNLTSGVAYTLPDGYRGIGCFFKNDGLLRLNVSTFDGKSCTIDQNTRYVTYPSGFDTKYYPADGSGDIGSTSTTQPDLGLGLFNRQEQDDGTYKNFTLTGKVRSDVIDASTGTHIEYTQSNTFKRSVLSVGMLFGTLYGRTTIQNVVLSGVDVRGAKYAGGFIGLGPNSTSKSIDIVQDANNNGVSSDITVYGVSGVGGMIGRWQSGIPTINYNGHNFNITKIISETKTTPITTEAHFFGVGGIVGVCRAGGGNANGTAANDGTIKKIVIGDPNQTSAILVKCSEETAGLNTGGLMGTLNRCSPNISDCYINNVSVSSNGSNTYVGGAVGFITTYCKVQVSNVHIYTNETVHAAVAGKGYCGGIIGQTPLLAKDGTLAFTLLDSSIEGYIISGNIVGGIVGERNSWRINNVGFDMRLENFEITKCTITGTGNNNIAGGLIGHVVTPVKGYNVKATDLTITGDTTGYVIGKMSDDDIGLIRLVAFSRQETDPNKTMLAKIVGSYTTYEYGINGYVIFADYLGENGNQAASSFNATNNIASFKSPYVHVNPKANVQNGFLTGDGVSPIVSVQGGMATEALKAIYEDVISDKPNYIRAVSGYNASNLSTFKSNVEEKYSSYITRLSSFDEEAREKLSGVSTTNLDFPVLILDISNKSSSTNYINDYIHLLTNTSSSDAIFANFAAASNAVTSEIYNVVLTRYYINGSGNLVAYSGSGTDTEQCFNIEEGKFVMDPDKTDTKAAQAQFTLMDVQFFDPSNPSKIAYHLYIPVYCRKLLEYEFRVHISSGTSYAKTNPVTSISNNNLLENLGVPVTLEFAYTYKRNAAEWQDAVNGGDNLLANYPKKLQFKNSTTTSGGVVEDFPTSTKMVLVDDSNYGKAYYLDSLTNDAFTTTTTNTKDLILNKFKDSSNGYFAPVNLNDLLVITATVSPDGKFVICDNVLGGDPTVRVNSGSVAHNQEMRLYEDSDASNMAGRDRYNLTISIPDGATEVSERYFLTIYTPEIDSNTAGKVYHYEINSPGNTLGDSPCASRLKSGSNQSSHLLIGDMYDDTLEVELSSNHEINDQNPSIDVDMTATIALTAAGSANAGSFLSSASIYHSFLVKLDKFDTILGKSEKGILAENMSTSLTNCKIGTEDSLAAVSMNATSNSNYVEIKTGQSFADVLATNNAAGKATVITSTLTMTFDDNDISMQFYPQSDDRGTKVIAYSNIASDVEKTAFSTVSREVEPTDVYYTNSAQDAKLYYVADGTVAVKYPQLGINPLSGGTAFQIKTCGHYDISDCKAQFETAEYIKCTLQLQYKQDNYSTYLNLGDYFTNVIPELNVVTSETSMEANSTTWSFVIAKSTFGTIENDLLAIPIDLTVKSGSVFEANSKYYSNYKVTLTVSMLETLDGADICADNDYIIYTNARIYTGRVNPNKQ